MLGLGLDLGIGLGLGSMLRLDLLLVLMAPKESDPKKILLTHYMHQIFDLASTCMSTVSLYVEGSTWFDKFQLKHPCRYMHQLKSHYLLIYELCPKHSIPILMGSYGTILYNFPHNSSFRHCQCVWSKPFCSWKDLPYTISSRHAKFSLKF